LSGFGEKKWEYNEIVQQFIDLKNTYVSVKRELLHNILIDFGMPMELARLFTRKYR
jgi:hypothetical protein